MGNPLLKNYNIEKEPFLSGGFNNLWKIYKGSRKDRKQDVCVFVMEKKSLEKYPKEEREEILNVLKKEAGALVKFKHPSVLGIYEQVSEDKQSLIFVTEPVQHTLASWVEQSGTSKLEVKLMITEICHVLSFLHDDAHVIHTAINPDNVFINPQGHVKMSGLSFSISDPPVGGMEVKLNPTYPNALPCLRFVAPEIVLDSKAYYQADIFSLGMLIYNSLKFIKGDTDRDLLSLNGQNSIDTYKKAISLMENKMMKIAFESDDHDALFKALNRNPQARPTIKEFLEHPWFSDPKLKALRFIENLEQNEANKNTEFLAKLPNILSVFESKIIERRFLPCLMNALKIENLIVSALPAIFAICESSNFKIDFETLVWPGLKTLFQMKQIPAAGLYYLLSKINYIAEKISNSEFSSNMLNIICKALDCGVAKIQSVVLENLLFIIKKVDSLAFKNQIYPRLVNIVLNTNSNTLKVSILKNFTTVYSLLDQNIINESLLNTLEKIRKSDNSSEVCMSVIAIYEEIAKVVSVESIANKILPNLISILVSGNISKKNFENIMSIVQKYLTRIKESREKDLSDDSTMNSSKGESKDLNFMNSMNSFQSSTTEMKKTTTSEKEDFNFLDSFFGSGSGTGISSFNKNIQNPNNPISVTTQSTNNTGMDFDYINKSLETSTKKTNNNTASSFSIGMKLENKKDKTIFDGIKDNTTGASNSTNMFQFNSPSGPSGTNKNKTQGDSLNFDLTFNKSGNPTPSTSSNNVRNNFPSSNSGFNNNTNMNMNFDFSKNNPSKNNQNANILDSLLNDLPNGTGSSNNNVGGMNTINTMNTMNNNFNLNDDYNLDFLKNNKQTTTQNSASIYNFNSSSSNMGNKPNSAANDPFAKLSLNSNNKNDQKNILDNLLKF